VGDEVRHIEATKPLGVMMIAVGWGYTGQNHLAAHAADDLFACAAEFLEILSLRSARASLDF
jgi:phosphoglycolate phosphatase-like HAD superfamily hydrolase